MPVSNRLDKFVVRRAIFSLPKHDEDTVHYFSREIKTNMYFYSPNKFSIFLSRR